MYLKQGTNGINVWVSWVDDLIAIGPNEDVLRNTERTKSSNEYDDIGWINEYVGCKIETNREEKHLRFTQPVLLQSFKDEFELPDKTYQTPAESKQVLQHTDDDELLDDKYQSEYRSGVGKLLHLMWWSRP